MRCPSSFGRPGWSAADGAGDGGHAALLPPERQERLLRIKQSEKRREPLCAYLILRHALWEQYRWRELPPIRLTSLGKPYFPDFPEVHFNLSHTTGAVLVALSGEPVGVDIEHIRPVSEPGHAASGGCDHGTGLLPELGPAGGRAKRSGAGVGTMLASETPLQPGERFYFLDTFPGYVAGVATRTGARQARCANTPWMR